MGRDGAMSQVSGGVLIAAIAVPRVFAGQRPSRRRYVPRGVAGVIRGIGGIAVMAAWTAAHYYQDCGDPDCMMFGCRAYKTGWRDGYDTGWMEGEAAGFAAGMAAAGGGG